MELQSPYLEAIQAIPGSTPGQKFKELNMIARRIADGTKAHGDSVPVIQISEVPEGLLPLVRVEIANVLQQSNGVVEALKSEDSEVVDRALRLNWFFRGNNKDVISIDYFERYILPYVSLNTRVKLIKRLSTNLRTTQNTKLAEDFYAYFARKYGRSQAEPLFIACGEEFIYETVKTHKIILSCRIVKNLFVKHPEVVIRYLKLSIPGKEAASQNVCKINMYHYKDFLPRLIKKHLNAFVELLEKHDSWFNIKLSNKSTEMFLKNNVDAFLNNPLLFVQIMSLKVITAKLTKVQFKNMFVKLYLKKRQSFKYDMIKNYLEFYPEQERMSLIIDSYKEAYNANLLDNHDAIDAGLLCMLPVNERVRQARIKLEKEPDWRERRHERFVAWRCYLPIEESVPSIKTEITKCSSSDDRQHLLDQMFYTCKVNDDKDALIEALRYFTTRHKNEKIWLIFDVLQNLSEYFDLYTLGKDHWAILNDFIKFLDVKDQLTNNVMVAKKIIAASLYYDLVHELPIENNIDMIIKINMKYWNPSWSILEKYPEYDRRCCDIFFSTIPLIYPQDNNVWKGRRYEIVESIVKSMYEFNTRNVKSNNKIEKLSVKNYPWLCEVLKNVIQSEPEEMRWQVESIVSILKTNEPELYKEWFPADDDDDEALSMQSPEALTRLRDLPQNILDHWEAYLKKVKTDVSWPCAQRFVKISRWHQDIPIKFAERCLKDIANNTDDCDNSLLILSLLMEGSALARVIEPVVPKDSTIEITDKNSKETYRIISTIPRAMNIVNPPVPLSLILSFCDGDYLNLALTSLTNTCRRTSVEKIRSFTKTLVDRRVSVKKHGIRLFCLVASIDELKIFLTDLWKTETHRSIRGVVFTKIYNIFVSDPTPDTWAIMKECINDLKIDDNDSVDYLVTVYLIPDEYLADYTKHLLEKLEKLQADGFSPKRIVQHIVRVISSINEAVINLLPEDFCQELIRKYFCNPIVEQEINEAGTNYVLDAYLRPDKAGLESRLSFFCTVYEDILKRHWDVPHPKHPMVYPINYLSHNFVQSLACAWSNNANKTTVLEAILRSYLAVLKPDQDFASYALLTLSVAFKEAKTSKDLANKIGQTLPRIVEALSPELVVELADIVRTLIKNRIDSENETNYMYRVIEALCAVGTVHSCILAAKLLFCDDERKIDDRSNKIVKILRQAKHPAVVSLVYQYVNTYDFTN